MKKKVKCRFTAITLESYQQIFKVVFFRDSPSKDIVNLAKKRALERREREKQKELEKPA